MAIYARLAGSRDVAGLLNSVVCNCDPLNGYLLIWNEDVQAFVVSPPPSSLNAVNNTNTYGGTHTITVNAGISNNTLNFKNLVAGSGIFLSQTNQSVLISSNITAERLSVPENYRITIDNDGNSGDAKFEVWTALSSPGSPTIIQIIPPQLPQTVQYVYSGNDTTGYFQTVNGFDFVADGFTDGQFIFVNNAGDQTGEWFIDNVYNTTVGPNFYSRIQLTELFTGSYGFNMGGPKLDVEFVTAELNIPAPDSGLLAPYNPLLPYKLEAYSIDFGPFGYGLTTGMIIQISGSKNGYLDGSYTVETVIPRGPGVTDYSTLIFSPNTPLPAYGIVKDNDLFSPELTLTIQTYEADTGFYVKKDGTVRGKEFFISLPPSQPDSAVSKHYVDTVSTHKVNAYFMSFFS